MPIMQRISSIFGVRRGPLPPATPMKEMGVSGTAVIGGYVQSRETSTKVAGAERWRTYADLVTNTSIVAAGVRHFLNLIARAEWKAEPVDDTPGAQEAAEFLESVMHDMATPWGRVARRAAMYRFHGFGVQEWTGKRRKEDGRIGFDNIEARPQHTIERWEVDDNGTVIGMWQRSPQTGAELFLPRQKVVYLVDDTLTDSPEGLGLFRHLVDPNERLKEFLRLEGVGFARDLRGIPVGRVPYTALRNAVKDGRLEQAEADKLAKAMEDFVQLQAKEKDTSLVLDSQPYYGVNDSGQTVSSTSQWGVELLTGDANSFGDIAKAIDRLNHEMARVLDVEHLFLGDTSGSRALDESKSRNLWQTVNSTLGDIADAFHTDIVAPIWSLNGLPDELKPSLRPSDVSWRSVQEVTAALRDMANAGAMLMPDDPAIDEVRGMLGLSPQPEIDPELMGAMGGNRGGRSSADPDADDLNTLEENA